MYHTSIRVLSLSPPHQDPRKGDSYNVGKSTLSLYVIIFKYASCVGKIIEVLNMLEETPAWKEIDALVRQYLGNRKADRRICLSHQLLAYTETTDG